MRPSFPNQDTPLPPPTEMEETALFWFNRCQTGLSDEQEIGFQDWLAADPRHAELFNELDGTWGLLGRAGAPIPFRVVTPAYSARLRWLRRVALPLAAAAAIAVTYLSWWRPAHYAGAVATEIGALRALRLPDGSVVTLNTDSAVAAAFTPAERRIRLERGEAHFTVARNPDRPFIVEAGGVAIRAVGTAFNVRLEAKAVEVLVTEGRVRVDDSLSGTSLLARGALANEEVLSAHGQPVLASGQKVQITRPAPVARVEPRLAEAAAIPLPAEEIQRELAWRDRRLEFELATLDEIVAEFNRYSRHRLVIDDAALAQKRFGGSFKPDDQAGFVRMLQDNYGVTAVELESATVLRSAR